MHSRHINFWSFVQATASEKVKMNSHQETMNPNHSEALQQIYSRMLSSPAALTFSSLLASFASVGNSSFSSGTTFNTQSFSLDSDIPKEEIECDVELVLVKNLNENLKKLDANLNGLHGRKFGFREVIDMASARPAYPSSPNISSLKRKRSLDSPIGSSLAIMPLTPESIDDSTHEEMDAKKASFENDSTLNDSTTSSHDGKLLIDWNERAVDADQDKENQLKGAGENKEAKAEVEEYKPAFLRIERLRNIQKKKPKFNISTTDLEYHSNMARQFPGSENRSEDQQVRRDKNTLAARISRTKNKAYEKMLTDQSLTATTENIRMKRRIACLRVYASLLMEDRGLPAANFGSMWEDNIRDILGTSS